MTPTLLILPGLFNSEEGHWQTLWERMLPNAERVLQKDWNAPHRTDWVAALDTVIAGTGGPIVLAAHSLGCALTVWWANIHRQAPHASRVKGALLVAPPDVERADFPEFVSGFAPIQREPLPFKTFVVASNNDPWCSLSTARSWASDWHADFHDIGPRGHINADSGLGDWPQGRRWLEELVLHP